MYSLLEDQGKERLRSLTFIKTGLRVKALKRRIRDITGVKVEGINIPNVYVYLKEKNKGLTTKVVRNILTRGRDIVVIGDFNRSFRQNRGRAQRLITLDKQAAGLNLLSNAKTPIRGTTTLDFVFNNIARALGGLNKIQSGLDYKVIQAWTALVRRKLFRIRIKVNIQKYKEQQDQEGELLVKQIDRLAKVVKANLVEKRTTVKETP